MTPLPLPLAILISGSILLVLAGIVAAIAESRYRRRGLKCIGCGCTDERACPGGCSWATTTPPICSNCIQV